MNLLIIITVFTISSVNTQTISSNFRCGDDWTVVGDEKCLKVLNVEMTRDEAISACSGQKRTTFAAKLLTIKSKSEQKLIENYLFNELNIKDNLWIGAQRHNASENCFQWEDGSELQFKNWALNRPTADESLSCAQMDPNSGQWYDMSCNGKALVVCEKLQFWTFPDLQIEFFRWRRLLENRNDKLTEELLAKDLKITSLETSVNELKKTQLFFAQEFEDFKSGFVSVVNNSINDLIGGHMKVSDDLSALDKKVDNLVEAVLQLHNECAQGCSGNDSPSDGQLESLRKELMAEISNKFNPLADQLKDTVSDARLAIVNHRRSLQIMKNKVWNSLGYV